MRAALDGLAGRAYAAAYDAVVAGFPPYEALVGEVAALVERVAGAGPARVLDVSCGTGTLAARLARRGHDVVGLDAVGRLVATARRRTPPDLGDRLAFHHLDIARDPCPGGDPFDVVVIPHTLYWHPDPAGFLAGCWQALGPGGHVVTLTYARPPRVVGTFRAIRNTAGLGDGLRALRWLVPTALFEALRDARRRYLGADEVADLLDRAGFEVLECRPAFLAGVSLLTLARRRPLSTPSPRSDAARHRVEEEAAAGHSSPGRERIIAPGSAATTIGLGRAPGGASRPRSERTHT